MKAEQMNDKARANFEQIAQWIDAHVPVDEEEEATP